jgi:hypothetical protein
MKAFLMHAERDFDLASDLPGQEQALMQDLELATLLRTMAAGDELIFDVARRALMLSLQEPEAIGYRQQVLSECLEHPKVVRDLYELAGEALKAERAIWGSLLRDSPRALLGTSVQRMEAFLEFLKRLRATADEHADKFSSPGFNRFFAMMREELDEPYFELIESHLKALKFNRGMLMSARLTAGNKGTGYTLRQPREQSLLGRVFDRSGYSFTVPDRDENGFRALSALEERGGEPGRQRRGAGGRTRAQLLRDAPGRARVLRRMPQPGRAADRIGRTDGVPGLGRERRAGAVGARAV